jgi:hypothetical protein
MLDFLQYLTHGNQYRIPNRRKRRCIGYVQMNHFLDRKAGVQSGGQDVDAFGGITFTYNLAP